MANTLKKAVAWTLLGSLMAAPSASAGNAQPKYDKKLAKAMADKAADAIGGLRDGFAIDETPVFIRAPDPAADPRKTGARPVDRTPTGGVVPAGLVRDREIRIVYDG